MDKRTAHDIVTRFILENRDPLYRFAYSYVRNREDALDIVQDSIYKALASAKSLDDPARVKTWCYRILVNSAMDFLRRRGRNLSEEVAVADPESDKYQDFDLRAAISELSARNRTIIVLRYYEDMTLDEIAEVVGQNVNTVKTALYSSLKRLRIQLEEPRGQE